MFYPYKNDFWWIETVNEMVYICVTSMLTFFFFKWMYTRNHSLAKRFNQRSHKNGFNEVGIFTCK